MNPEHNKNTPKSHHRNPWAWVPTLYIAEGLPLVLVMTVSTIMYTQLGASLSAIGFWTSLLGFAWTIKPLWGPLVDLYWTKRRWSVLMQILMGVLLGIVAFTLQTDWWWSASLLALATVALFSATHDIAADGFYMDALDEKQQAFFVGIRSTFYRIAMIFGQGVLLIIAGMIEQNTGPDPSQLIVSAKPVSAAVAAAPASEAQNGFVKFEPSVVQMDAGTTAAVMVSLNEQPDTTRTVTLRRTPSSPIGLFFPVGAEQAVALADKKFEVLKFNAENWNQPQEIVVKVEEKLGEPINVPFKAASGNLPLTWALCFGGVGLIMLSFGIYHVLVLPRPLADGSSVTPSTPFVMALGVMALVVIVPVALYVLTYYLFFDGVLGVSTWLNNSTLFNWAGLEIPAGAQPYITAFIILVGLFAIVRAAHHRSGITGKFILSTLVGVLVITALVHFGLSDLINRLSAWISEQYNRTINVSEASLKFLTIGLIIFLVWLILKSSALKAAIKNSFSSAARISQVPFDEVFASFFAKPGIGRMVAFLLLYRLGEGLLVKMSGPFLIKPVAVGGIGLSSGEYGFAYGALGVFTMIIGGILGGIVASRYGLKRWLLPMCVAINIPDALYVYMAYYQPVELWKIYACVAGETFGYGFGFTGYMLYMLYIAGTGEHKTSHFALCTGFMSLGMLIPGMLSGDIAEGLVKAFPAAPNLGWMWFFVIVCIATIPGFIMLGLIPLDKEFGRRSTEVVEE